MTFKDSEVPTISDLITYFGVPLTVIGALPIVYNVFVTLVHLQRIRRVLTRNEMAALARIHSDIFNRVVEVELPKYFIQSPTDSSATESRSIGSDRGIQLRNLGPGTSRLREGFSKPTKPSDIPGGSWTFLEWEPHQIRSKTQRTKPGDKLRQPQAQIRFWDLILRLYQLGARVTIDKKDWSELHSSPLWTRELRKKHDSESDLENMLSTPPRKGPELQRASISWLPAQGHIPHEESAEEAIKAILSRMVTDQDFSRSLGQMLENWCEWARRGAMNVADFCDIYQDKATFARAILLIVTLSEIENGPAAALIIMQECAAKWDYVELG
ncbi:hypothetical protein LY76DRAFT_681717 [Colletotrichum caudatum]|nr:hypothetical protein LY76DRAFT_681717 [Colletotrichum caudatum]